MKYIPYGRQFIDKKDKELVLKALSNNLITTGPYVERFEKVIKKYLNCKYSYTCSSGTAAIHLAMLSVGLKEGDTILMPAVNFIASYNMAINMKLKIYLVDVDEYTGQITPIKLLECIKKNKLKKINALIIMYHGGYPENVNQFYDIKKLYNFFIIEDACHALGSEYKYKNKYFKIGSCRHADVSTFSLHPVKTITSGEGGIVTTNKSFISQNIKLFRNHGIMRNKKKHWLYDITRCGFNYRLSDINCALGFSQLKKINFFIKRKKNIHNKYLKEFENYHSSLLVPKYLSEIRASHHLFILHLKFDKIKKTKDNFIKYLMNKKIFVQQHYIPIYKFSVFNKKLMNFSGSEKYFNNSISIPIYVNLNNKDQNKVIKIIKNYFK